MNDDNQYILIELCGGRANSDSNKLLARTAIWAYNYYYLFDIVKNWATASEILWTVTTFLWISHHENENLTKNWFFRVGIQPKNIFILKKIFTKMKMVI